MSIKVGVFPVWVGSNILLTVYARVRIFRQTKELLDFQPAFLPNALADLTKKSGGTMKQPLARQSSLLVKTVDDETLVYDLETDKAHCLNDTAARIWKSCDGQTTVAAIAEQLSSPGQIPVDENVVWLALDQLEKFKLLDEAPAKPASLSGLTRRQMVARLGIAAVALPAIVSIVSPHAAAQGSLRQPGVCCVSPNDCQSGTCQQEGPTDPPCAIYPPNPQQSGKFCQ
jgi:hypothetical protein